MREFFYFFWLGLAACVLTALHASAQQTRNQKDPHIGFIYPAGGKQGTLFEATVGGQNLQNVRGVRGDGEDLQISVVKYTRPLTRKEFGELRDKLMEARAKTGDPGMGIFNSQVKLEALAKEIGFSDETIASLVDYRKKLEDPKRQLNPQLAESVLLKIYVPPTAKLGCREIRLVTTAGLSNPLRFYIGDLPEFQKPESNTKAEQKAISPLEKLPVTINGQLLPGHVDRYSFSGRMGRRIVVRAQVRSLIPYLADAVPGWFQAGLTLYDAKGREVAHAENFRFDPDPAFSYEVPEDGIYTLEVKDALYRGREDFIYRVTVGEVPFVTGIFPLGGREGEKTVIQASGWNLPENPASIEKWGQTAGMQTVSVASNLWNSNAVPFQVDTLPESLEVEPNNDVASAQKLTMPLIVNGRIQKAGDWDVFCIDGRGSDQIVAEVWARRLNSPLDSILVLVDANGKKLAANDDYEDKGEGFSTHHADSVLSYTLPTTGRYYLRLGNTQHEGGPDYGYRLRVSLKQPDFALRVVPSCINGRAGAVVPITVYALRKDGFDGEIALSLKTGPAGATLEGAKIPAGTDQVRLTLAVPGTCTVGSYLLAVEGKTTTKAEEIRRVATPADDMMQAFSYRHLVTADEQVLTVLQGGRYASLVKLAQALPVKLRRGEANRIRFTTLPAAAGQEQLKLELNEPLPGLSVEDSTKDSSSITVVLRIDDTKLKENVKGNLIFDAIGERTPPPVDGKKNAKVRVPLGTLPAIPFEITN